MNTSHHNGGALNGSASITQQNGTSRKGFADMSDNELVAEFINHKDGPALQTLMQRVSPLLQSRAFSILKNESDTDDAVQNTWIEFTGIATNLDSRPVQGILITTVRRRAIDLYRKRQTVAKHIDFWGDVLASENVGMQPSLSEANITSREVDRFDSILELARVLATLPVAQCETLVLVSQHTQREVALLTSAPLGTVKTRIELGLKKAKDAFQTKHLVLDADQESRVPEIVRRLIGISPAEEKAATVRSSPNCTNGFIAPPPSPPTESVRNIPMRLSITKVEELPQESGCEMDEPEKIQLKPEPVVTDKETSVPIQKVVARVKKGRLWLPPPGTYTQKPRW